ncbi:MAG TPA: hypothetical protein VGJ59_20240 [Jatrophihabitantaceae bacterium]|jgi:hypothetical protein
MGQPLAESERVVLLEAEKPGLLSLEEDDLIALHSRVRRARNKHVKLYRRQASTRVAGAGGRGAARPANLRNLQKAELFEDALARVSRQLAVVARRTAAELKAERLAAARAMRGPGPVKSPPPQAQPVRRAPRAKAPSAASVKQRAGAQAVGARKQARRDSR